MNNGYIRYATDRSLPTAIEIKRANIEKEILRRTGMKVKVSLKQTQKYLAEELKMPKMAFDIKLWNNVINSR